MGLYWPAHAIPVGANLELTLHYQTVGFFLHRNNYLQINYRYLVPANKTVDSLQLQCYYGLTCQNMQSYKESDTHMFVPSLMTLSPNNSKEPSRRAAV